MRYSIFTLARNALSYHEGWQRAWRSPPPKESYEVVIVGGGGHGLATAYYLAKEHGITDVAVIEKGWLGGGNTGRNTTVVRADYLTEDANAFFGFSMTLWRTLARELNFNVMFSPRGVLKLCHSRQELRMMSRRTNAIRLAGLDSEMLTTAEVKAMVPILDTSPGARFPVVGGSLQRFAGTARHDAVAWGYARAADALGVDIIQNCEVTGIRREGGRVVGVETTRGFIGASRVGLAVAGHSSVLAAMAGLTLPIQSYALQAFVSEPIKPVLDTVVASSQVFVYLSQSDKGELVIGGGLDGFPSYAQRGSLHRLRDTVAAAVALFPVLSRLKLMRQWAGIVDTTPDDCPIIDRLPVAGLYLDGGWGTGGFKATPASGFVFAHTIARDEPHPLARPFALDRFARGRLVNEHLAAGGFSH